MSKFKPVSITPIIPEKTFRAFVQTVLPTIYDDSLSYYELLNKAVKILNTNIQNVAILSENQEKFIEEVTNYINSLEISIVPYDIALNFDVDTFDEMKATIANGGICCIALLDTDGSKNYLYYSNDRYYSDSNQNRMTFNGLTNIKHADDYSDNNAPSIITLSLEKVNDAIVVSYNKKYKVATEHDVDTAFANAIAISVQTYAFSYNVDTDTLSVSDVTRDIVGAINNNRICVCKVIEKNKPDVECYYSGRNSVNNAEKLVFVGNIIENGVCVGTKTVNIDADADAFLVEGVTSVNDKYYADKDDVIFADFSVTINGNTITLNNASITPLDLLRAKLNNKKVIGRLFDTLAPVMPYRHAYYANSFFCSPISMPENITQNSINFNFIIKIDGNSIVQYLIKSNNNSAWSIEKTELNTDLSGNLLPDVTNDDNGNTTVVLNGVWNKTPLPYVTPEMYGAIGDGVNDDTEAVRSAMQKPYVILRGDYLITELIVASAHIITGKGTIRGNYGISFSNDVSISNINMIIGNNIDAVAIAAKGNLFINGIYVSGGRVGVLHDMRNKAVEIKNSKFINMTGDGARAIEVQFAQQCKIENNFIENISNSLNRDADGISIWQHPGVYDNPVTISGNRMHNCRGRFIKASTYNAVINNNYCYNDSDFTVISNFAGIDVQKGNSIVKGNEIHAIQGINVSIRSTGDIDAHHVIANNRLFRVETPGGLTSLRALEVTDYAQEQNTQLFYDANNNFIEWGDKLSIQVPYVPSSKFIFKENVIKGRTSGVPMIINTSSVFNPTCRFEIEGNVCDYLYFISFSNTNNYPNCKGDSKVRCQKALNFSELMNNCSFVALITGSSIDGKFRSNAFIKTEGAGAYYSVFVMDEAHYGIYDKSGTEKFYA